MYSSSGLKKGEKILEKKNTKKNTKKQAINKKAIIVGFNSLTDLVGPKGWQNSFIVKNIQGLSLMFLHAGDFVCFKTLKQNLFCYVTDVTYVTNVTYETLTLIKSSCSLSRQHVTWTLSCRLNKNVQNL